MSNCTIFKVALANLRMKAEMERAAQAIIDGMKTAILNKVGVDGSKVEENEVSTSDRKGFDHRMVDTGAYVKYGLTYKATDRSFIVAPKDRDHPGGKASYLQIAEWNQKGNDNVAVDKASNHFGLTKKAEEAAVKIVSDKIIEHLEKAITYKLVINKVVG